MCDDVEGLPLHSHSCESRDFLKSSRAVCFSLKGRNLTTTTTEGRIRCPSTWSTWLTTSRPPFFWTFEAIIINIKLRPCDGQLTLTHDIALIQVLCVSRCQGGLKQRYIWNRSRSMTCTPLKCEGKIATLINDWPIVVQIDVGCSFWNLNYVGKRSLLLTLHGVWCWCSARIMKLSRPLEVRWSLVSLQKFLLSVFEALVITYVLFIHIIYTR